MNARFANSSEFNTQCKGCSHDFLYEDIGAKPKLLYSNMAALSREKLLLLLLIRRRQLRTKVKYRKRFWVHPINRKWKQQREYANLIREMQLGDHKNFFKYFRMSPAVFKSLLQLVAPFIIKSDLNRESSQPAERLAVTLRYLATGDSHQTIAFDYRIRPFHSEQDSLRYM